MSYLRAIGVIILSAVLKRRMILADKAKSLFISKCAIIHISFVAFLSDSPLQHITRITDATTRSAFLFLSSMVFG